MRVGKMTKKKISKKALNKKGQDTNPLKIIVGAIIIILAAGILLFVFRDNLKKETDTVNDVICGLDGDYDSDGVPDSIDNCVCLDETKCDDPAERKKCREKRNEECG